MVNTYNKSGQLIRWKSYEKDRFNLITSRWNNGYIVLNLGTGKKGIRQYNVTKDTVTGEVHCNCYDHIENNSICKHMISVWNYNKQQQAEVKQQEEQERAERVQRAIAKW